MELVEERGTAARKQTGTFCTAQAGRQAGVKDAVLRRSSGGEKMYMVSRENQMCYVKIRFINFRLGHE